MTNMDVKKIGDEVSERFGAYLETKINPGTVERDRKCGGWSREQFKEAGRLGLFAFLMPKELGGEGRSVMEWALAQEQICSICDDIGFSLLLTISVDIMRLIAFSKNAGLIDRYLPPMIRGERLGCFCYTEASDPFSWKSLAVKQANGDYILNGAKTIITGGAAADVFFVFIRNEQDDLSAFVVEREDPGFEVIPLLDVHGARSTAPATLRLNDVRIPKDRVVVASDALTYSQRWLNSRQPFFACAFNGRMRSIYDHCIRQLQQTVRYGRALTEMANVQVILGKMYVILESCRSFVYRALEEEQAGNYQPLWDPLRRAAKTFVIDQGMQFAQLAFRIMGGRFYLNDDPIGLSRFHRDISCYSVAAGAQDTMEVDLGVNQIHRVRMEKDSSARMSLARMVG